MKRRVRSVFFGTPAIAVPALAALAATSDLVGVVCQPDKPAGRGMALHEPEVKQAAIALGLDVHQPVKVKTGDLAEWLRDRAPDVAVVLAYGRILPPSVLEAPRRGCLNLHASLLPKYRGAAPINWAIIHGEVETGVCLMQMDEGLDTGPVFSRRSLAIGPEETAGELSERIAELCAVVVREDVPRAVAGELHSVAQDDAAATFAPPLRADHLRVDWQMSGARILNLVRGLAPRPGAHTTLHGKRLRIGRLSATWGDRSAEPGTLETDGGRVRIRSGDGWLELLSAQLEGKKLLSARDLVNGRTLKSGERLG